MANKEGQNTWQKTKEQNSYLDLIKEGETITSYTVKNSMKRKKRLISTSESDQFH